MKSSESHVMLVCCTAVIVTRRSSASFGRIAIRFSCCDNQPTVFMNRSRLPCMPRPAFPAKSESPKTATRVSGLGALAAAPAVDAVDDDDTADAIVIGPCLSPLGALNVTLPDASKPLTSDSAQLRGLVWTNP